MKKRFIVMLLAMATLLCVAGCVEEKNACAECGETQAFLFQHDDGNLYCTDCRNVPAKVG